MPETQLGYTQLVKEVLNKEFKLNLQENEDLQKSPFHLIDINKEFIVGIDIFLDKQGEKEEMDKAIRDFQSIFRNPVFYFIYSTIIKGKLAISAARLISTFEKAGVKISILGVQEIIDGAIYHQINFTQHLAGLAKNDSNIQSLIDNFSKKTSDRTDKNTGPQTKKTPKPKINLEKEGNLDLSKSPKQKSRSDSSKLVEISDELLGYNYFYAKVIWAHGGNQINRFVDEKIWQVETGFSKNANLVKKGDILLGVKRELTTIGNNLIKYRVIAIGYVYKNENKANQLGVIWEKMNFPAFEADEISIELDLSLGALSKENIIPILQGMLSTLKIPLENIIKELQHQEDSNQNITRLAGIQSDSDDGDDYLDIERDVTAFARMMSAKSFDPPLAIGLLGKWGSGKSFFMRKLQKKVKELSNKKDQNIYCQGIAHIHFNAWSYMDANLWASIVTKIFEGLNLHINNKVSGEDEKRKIREEITKRLNITNRAINSLQNEKQIAEQKVSILQEKKKAVNDDLKKKIDLIKKKSIASLLEELNNSFQVSEKINSALNKNESFIKTSDQFKKIVPEEYWKNPSDIYDHFKSQKTFKCIQTVFQFGYLEK